MRIVAKIAIWIVGLVMTGTAALFSAGGLADAGMLGSCFEGACGYVAAFVVFPLLWLALMVAFAIGWRIIVRRRAIRG